MNDDRTIKISIIVPVYNVEDYIKDCFSSIICQTYSGPMECLFIDDCGSDSSIEVLNELIASYNGPIEMRVLHHQENRGLSAARNTGIFNSKGDYLFFLDSDDQLYPHTVISLSSAAIKDNLPDVVLGSYYVNEPDNPNNKFRYKYEVINGQPTIAKAYLEDKLFCMAPNKLVRRDFIINNNLFFKEGIIHEDNLWSFQSFHLAQKVVTIPELTYYYFIHSGSIMTASSCEKQLMGVKVFSDEVMKDVHNCRYELVKNDSLNYVKSWLVIKCGALLDQIYKKHLPRKERLLKLKSIPEELKPVMMKYLFSSSTFLIALKTLFRLRLFGLFDAVMSYLYSNSQRG